MRRLAGRKLFSVGKHAYRGEDLALAAHLWGEFAGLEATTRQGIACQRHLEALGEELPEALLDDAAEAWRYDRELLSADDTQAWLSARRLKTDEWLDFILRSALRRRWSGELERLASRYRVPRREFDGALYAEALCSGLLTRLSDRLADEAAVHALESDVEPGARPKWCSKTAVAKLLKVLPPAVRRTGIVGLGPSTTVDRAEHLACLSLSFARFVDRTADVKALRHEIESHVLDWTRVDCEMLAFASEEAAREAALLVREDGYPLARAATVAKSRLEKARYVIEDVGEPLKDRLVGASPGDLVGPLPDDGRFVLISVLRRSDPSLRDGATRKRAVQGVIGRTIQREVGRRVRWHERI